MPDIWHFTDIANLGAVLAAGCLRCHRDKPTEVIYEAGLPCVYSDGNAAVLITRFWDDPTTLGTHVDLPLMRQTMWSSTVEDPDRMRRRMAEFLVHESPPLELVAGIGVYSRRVRDAVVSLADEMGKDVKTAIRPGWYF